MQPGSFVMVGFWQRRCVCLGRLRCLRHEQRASVVDPRTFPSPLTRGSFTETSTKMPYKYRASRDPQRDECGAFCVRLRHPSRERL